MECADGERVEAFSALKFTSMGCNRRSNIGGVPLLGIVGTMLLATLRSLPVRAFTTSSLRRPAAPAVTGAAELSLRYIPRRLGMGVQLLSTLSPSELDQLNDNITTKGDEIRRLKESGAEKSALAPLVAELLALKSLIPTQDEPPTKSKKSSNKKEAGQDQPAAAQKAEAVVVGGGVGEDGLSASELRQKRLSKIDAMREAGVEPFAYTFHTTHTAAALAAEYAGALRNGEEDSRRGADVAVAGRILTRRVFGKLAFFTLQDETAAIQLQFDKGRLEEAFQVRARIACNFFADFCVPATVVSLTEYRVGLAQVATQGLDRWG